MAKNKHLDDLPPDHPEVVKDRLKTIRKFSKDFTSWASTSVVLIGINIFISGNISWAKWPVFFWGIFVVAEIFNVWRLKREQKEYEAKEAQKTFRRTHLPPVMTTAPIEEPIEDYSNTLLDQQARERELADLAEVRKLKRPWKDEDLV
jgi:hypothetical protein